MNLASQSAPKSNGTIVSARVRGQNVSFFVADETDLIQKEHFHGKFYEPEERKIISEFFPSGGIFVDIGANIGKYSICCSILVPSETHRHRAQPSHI